MSCRTTAGRDGRIALPPGVPILRDRRPRFGNAEWWTGRNLGRQEHRQRSRVVAGRFRRHLLKTARNGLAGAGRPTRWLRSDLWWPCGVGGGAHTNLPLAAGTKETAPVGTAFRTRTTSRVDSAVRNGAAGRHDHPRAARQQQRPAIGADAGDGKTRPWPPRLSAGHGLGSRPVNEQRRADRG